MATPALWSRADSDRHRSTWSFSPARKNLWKQRLGVRAPVLVRIGRSIGAVPFAGPARAREGPVAEAREILKLTVRPHTDRRCLSSVDMAARGVTVMRP